MKTGYVKKIFIKNTKDAYATIVIGLNHKVPVALHFRKILFLRSKFKLNYASYLNFPTSSQAVLVPKCIPNKTLFWPGRSSTLSCISHIQSFVLGMLKPYFLRFYVRGIGYKVWSFYRNKIFKFRIGLNHYTFCIVPNDIVSQARKYKFVCSSISYEHLKQFAYNLVSIKPPDPYRNKGIRYINDIVHQKIRKERRK